MSNEQEPPESGPAWAPQDPYAGDPPPGGLSPLGPGDRSPGEDDDNAPAAPPQAGGYAAGGYAGGGGYGSPQPGGYGGTPPSAYGPAPQQQQGPPQDPYGTPQQPYAAPSQDPYGAQGQNPYGGMPPQNPYGTPQQNPYGAQQQQAPYGTPQQNPYGAQQQAPYGTYGAQQQAPYGTGAPPGGPGAPGAPGGPGAPGYGGTPGTPGADQGWPPNYAPPPAQGSDKRPLIIISVGAGVIALLVAAVAVIGLSGGDGKGGKTNPPSVAASNAAAAGASRAAQGLGSVPALRYNGTFSSGGDDFQAQLSVTKGGSATGTIAVGGDKADLVSVDGNTYLKAPKAFWRDQGGVTTNPEDFAGRWAKAPDSAINLDIKNVLAAGSIIRGLQGVSSYQPAGGTENINGTPAIKVTGADAEYYISTANPPKLMRIVGTGTDTYRFDVAEVATTEVTALFQQLRAQVTALSGARDPSVRFLPAAKIKASNCGVSSCTMKLTVTTLSVGGGGSNVRAIMLGKITAGGKTGRTLGTCSDSATTSSGKKVSLSCTVRGGAWSSWVRGIRGSASYYVQARTVAESRDAGNLLSIVDREQQGA
jgi:hypothetical protein